MDTKPAVASVTIWGIVLAAICTSFPHLAAALHLTDPGVQASLTTIVGTFGTLVSLVLALYGRYHTSKPIAGILKSPSTVGGPPSLPPSVANVMIAVLLVGTLLVAAPLLSACATSPTLRNVTPAALRLNEGKALSAAYIAGDALAQGLDEAANAGLVKGPAALKARQALLDLQVGLSNAQAAYDAGDATAGGQIGSLVSLLRSASALIPMSASTSSAVSNAISLAQTFAVAI